MLVSVGAEVIIESAGFLIQHKYTAEINRCDPKEKVSKHSLSRREMYACGDRQARSLPPPNHFILAIGYHLPLAIYIIKNADLTIIAGITCFYICV